MTINIPLFNFGMSVYKQWTERKTLKAKLRAGLYAVNAGKRTYLVEVVNDGSKPFSIHRVGLTLHNIDPDSIYGELRAVELYSHVNSDPIFLSSGQSRAFLYEHPERDWMIADQAYLELHNEDIQFSAVNQGDLGQIFCTVVFGLAGAVIEKMDDPLLAWLNSDGKISIREPRGVLTFDPLTPDALLRHVKLYQMTESDCFAEGPALKFVRAMEDAHLGTFCAVATPLGLTLRYESDIESRFGMLDVPIGRLLFNSESRTGFIERHCDGKEAIGIQKDFLRSRNSHRMDDITYRYPELAARQTQRAAV